MAEHLELSTEELVCRCRAGDRGAFGELVVRFQDAAYGLAYYHVGRRDDALDIAQQAFLAAYVHLHELAEPARFGGWLARIVTNQCLHWRRRRRPAVALDAPAVQGLAAPEWESPEAAAERGELQRQVRRGAKEITVPAAPSQALALAAAANAPIRATAAAVAAGGLAEGGRTPPEPTEVARAAEGAAAIHRLSQALAAAARGRRGAFTVRLVPTVGRAAGQVRVVAPDGAVLDTIPSLALGFTRPGDATELASAGRIEISGAGAFAVTVRPGLTETRLDLSPAPAGQE